METQCWAAVDEMDGQFTTAVDCRVGYSHGGDVLSRKGIGGVADEQAGLTHGSARDAQDVLFSRPGIGFADRHWLVK